MLTPDAYPEGDDFLERLTAPVRTGRAAVAYGRQLPREGAGLLERFGREFNYPAASQVRSLEDWSTFGSYTHFCSNACAAWSNAALDMIGGFRATLVSEETVAVAELLARGERIAYVADAVVRHSHAYDLADGFGATSTSAGPAPASATCCWRAKATRPAAARSPERCSAGYSSGTRRWHPGPWPRWPCACWAIGSAGSAPSCRRRSPVG